MRMTIRRRMILTIALPTAVIYLAAYLGLILMIFGQSRAVVRDLALDMTTKSAVRFDDYIRKAARVADTTAAFLSVVPRLSEAEMYALLTSTVEGNDRVYGAAMAFETNTFLTGDALFCPYVHKGPDGLEQMNISREVFDWHRDSQWAWWHEAKAAGHGIWTEPYFDEGAGNIYMVTYSAPFFTIEGTNRTFRGVTTVDIDLRGLDWVPAGRLIGGLNPTLFILAKEDGTVIHGPAKEDIGENTIFDLTRESDREDVAEFAEALREETHASLTSEEDVFETKNLVVAHTPVPTTGWLMVAYVPKSMIFTRVWERLSFVTVLTFAALALIVGSILWMSGRLVQPLVDLTTKVRTIAAGDLDTRVDPTDAEDEIGELARSFNRMTSDLKTHIRRLAREEAEREQAEAANRAKSDFLSHMSHELRTPLNGILGYAQILQRDPQTPTGQRKSLSAIVNCGDHLLSLINDVLDLSKIEAGRLDLDVAPSDLHGLLESVGDMISQRAATKGLAFRVDVAPEVPRGIRTDAAKLRQILVNLLGNAVKFTDAGEVVLSVREHPRDTLAFSVRDTGVGISKEDIRAIFDPFKQVEAGKAAGGTGLGLAISRRLAEALGGSLDAESEPGQGSCFTFSLPLIEESRELLLKLQHHLDAERVDAPQGTEPAEGKDAPLPTLSPEDAARLREHLAIRNLTGVTSLAEALAADPATSAAGRHIAELAQAFDFAGLARFAEEQEAEESSE